MAVHARGLVVLVSDRKRSAARCVGIVRHVLGGRGQAHSEQVRCHRDNPERGHRVESQARRLQDGGHVCGREGARASPVERESARASEWRRPSGRNKYSAFGRRCTYPNEADDLADAEFSRLNLDTGHRRTVSSSGTRSVELEQARAPVASTSTALARRQKATRLASARQLQNKAKQALPELVLANARSTGKWNGGSRSTRMAHSAAASRTNFELLSIAMNASTRPWDRATHRADVSVSVETNRELRPGVRRCVPRLSRAGDVTLGELCNAGRCMAGLRVDVQLRNGWLPAHDRRGSTAQNW